MKKKESRFCKQLLRAIFYITFEFISDMNTHDQVQISSRDTDANSKENQVDSAKTKNKLKKRPDLTKIIIFSINF